MAEYNSVPSAALMTMHRASPSLSKRFVKIPATPAMPFADPELEVEP